MFSYPFGRYRYVRLLFRAALETDMFQKIDELFGGMTSKFCIADGNLIAGFNEQGTNHDTTLEKEFWVCRWANLNLNKDKCLLRFTITPFFHEIISQQSVSPAPRNVQALIDILPPKVNRNCSCSWV